MATHLDLEEQEQLDQLKAFWQRYGNLVTWVLVAVLGAYAAWNGWNYWQRDQAGKAALMYDELDVAARSGDAERTINIFADMRGRYAGALPTQQGGLLAARVAVEKGRIDDARAALAWVADNASDASYRAVARLRLAGIALDEGKYDDALKQLAAVDGGEFSALVADRRGDVLQAQGKLPEARAAYEAAWQGMDPEAEYRRLIEAKLNVVGGAVPAAAARASGATP